MRRRRPVAPEALLDAIAHRLEVEPTVLRGPDRDQAACRARALAAYLLVRSRGCPVGQVAALLGRDVATVSQLVWRVARRLLGEAALRERWARLGSLIGDPGDVET